MNAETWPIVIVESPYAGDVKGNMLYLHQCLRDCLRREEVPYASHLFFTQFLDDAVPSERKLGMTAGYAMWRGASRVVFYLDGGWSPGMLRAKERAAKLEMPIEERYLYPDSTRENHDGHTD